MPSAIFEAARRALVPMLLIVGLASAGLASAQAASLQPASGDVDLSDFAFHAGGSLPDLKLHYLTLGTPRRDAAGAITNAVVLLHGTTGTAAGFLAPGFADALYGAGQPLDTERWFLVIPDGIGAGGSSKPSDGLRARFPRYGYRDQVRGDLALLERLGVGQPRLVLGTSMGGMQVWLWAEMAQADAFVAIAATPAAISGRNEVWRLMISEAIRRDPDWQGGDYPAEHPPRDWARTAMPLFSIMTSNAEAMQRKAPTRAAAVELVGALARGGETRDANDVLYQFESSYDYDPAGQLGAIRRPLLAINFADDLLNPPELLHLPDGPPFSAALLPAGPGSYGHETLAHAERWAPALARFLAGVPGWR